MNAEFEKWCKDHYDDPQDADLAEKYHDHDLQVWEAAQAALRAPSPCEVNGHWMLDWFTPDNPENTPYCLACQREAMLMASEALAPTEKALRDENERLRAALTGAAKSFHRAAFEYLNMGRVQRAYSWHDVEDALTSASKALAPPSAEKEK